MFKEKQFNIPELKGISQKNIEEHLKLYSGYVKNANLILGELSTNENTNPEAQYSLAELQRRFGFEFDGMRNHEYYFSLFEGGPSPLSDQSELRSLISSQWGSYEKWLAGFKKLAMTRGVGWAMLYYDKDTHTLLNAWVEEQHLGHLVGLTPIVALDMWEHAYVYDFPTSEKKNYVDAFFENINWSVAEKKFKSLQ